MGTNATAGASRTLVRIQVRDEAAKAGLRAARKELNKDTKEVMLELATRRVVPRARRAAPSIVAGSIIARATARSVYLTTKSRGMNRRIFGLLEFGGQVRGVITHGPGHQAIHFTTGGRSVFVRYVKGPRNYKPKAFLRKAVDRERRGFMRELNRTLPNVIQRRLDTATARSALT